MEIWHIILDHWYHILGGAGFVWLGQWVVRRQIDAARTAVTDTGKKIDKILDIVTVQNENHLSTIERESLKQTALLGTMSVTLAEQKAAAQETNNLLRTVVDLVVVKNVQKS